MILTVKPAYAESFGVASAHLSHLRPAQRGEGGTHNVQRSNQTPKSNISSLPRPAVNLIDAREAAGKLLILLVIEYAHRLRPF